MIHSGDSTDMRPHGYSRSTTKVLSWLSWLVLLLLLFCTKKKKEKEEKNMSEIMAEKL